MELSLETLHAEDSFVSSAPVKKTVTWTNTKGVEKSAVVFIKKRNFISVTNEFRGANSGDTYFASRIATHVVNSKGQPIFKPGDITGEGENGAICDSLGLALLALISEVNSFDKQADPKPLPLTESSGTSLSLPESAEKQ